MVKAPTSPEVKIAKYVVLKTDLAEKQFVYLLCYVSAFS